MLNPQPSTLNPQPSTLNPLPSTLNPRTSALNPQPSTLDPRPSTLNPKLYTLFHSARCQCSAVFAQCCALCPVLNANGDPAAKQVPAFAFGRPGYDNWLLRQVHIMHTHTRTHARTHARTRARTHTYTSTHARVFSFSFSCGRVRALGGLLRLPLRVCLRAGTRVRPAVNNDK